MPVLLCSDDITLLSSWKDKITISKCEILEEIDEIAIYSSTIAVFDYAYCYKILPKLIAQAEKSNIKILLLDRTPTFEKGKNVLSLGVHGYGNVLMSSSYINSAIETIKNQMIWIYPEFTTLLIKGLNEDENEIAKETLSILTNKEQDIARLIKEGFSNKDISQHLNISINTVKSHIKSIYEKLNVKNRLSLSILFTK